jgi:hypothetical protein
MRARCSVPATDLNIDWERYRISRERYHISRESYRERLRYPSVVSVDPNLLHQIAHIATLAKVPPCAQADIARLLKNISYEIAREWLHYRLRETDPSYPIIPGWYRRRHKSKMNHMQQLSREMLSCLKFKKTETGELDVPALLSIGLMDIRSMGQRIPEGLRVPEGLRAPRIPGARDNCTIDLAPKMEDTIDFTPTMEVLAAFDEAASRVLSSLRTKSSRKRGRPAGRRYLHWSRPGSFDSFVLRLLLDVRDAGGHFTLSKNTGTGTLIKALEILRPHLPPKFIPKNLTPSGLVRIRGVIQKIGTEK